MHTDKERSLPWVCCRKHWTRGTFFIKWFFLPCGCFVVIFNGVIVAEFESEKIVIHLLVRWNEKGWEPKWSSDEQWCQRATGEISVERHERSVCVCLCVQVALVHTHLGVCFIVVGPLILNHVTFRTNASIFLLNRCCGFSVCWDSSWSHTVYVLWVHILYVCLFSIARLHGGGFVPVATLLWVLLTEAEVISPRTCCELVVGAISLFGLR